MQVLTVPEVATALRVTEATIRSLIRVGKLRAFHVGSRVRVLQSEVQRFALTGGAAPATRDDVDPTADAHLAPSAEDEPDVETQIRAIRDRRKRSKA